MQASAGCKQAAQICRAIFLARPLLKRADAPTVTRLFPPHALVASAPHCTTVP